MECNCTKGLALQCFHLLKQLMHSLYIISSSQVQEMSEKKYRDEDKSTKVLLEQMKEILTKLPTKQ